jgi:hypothetical protein
MPDPNDRGASPFPMPTHPRMAAGYPTSSQPPSTAQPGITGYVEAAREGGRRMLHEGEQWIEHESQELWGNLQNAIRRYPVAAVAAGFGLGCLLTCCLAAWRSSPDDIARRMSRYSA